MAHKLTIQVVQASAEPPADAGLKQSVTLPSECHWPVAIRGARSQRAASPLLARPSALGVFTGQPVNRESRVGHKPAQCHLVFAEAAQHALVGQAQPGAKPCWPPYRRIRPLITLRLSSNLRPICNRPVQGFKPAAGYNPAPHPPMHCLHPGKPSGIELQPVMLSRLRPSAAILKREWQR